MSVDLSEEAGGRILANLRVVDLKEELDSRALSTKGKKTDLIARLKQALEAEGHDAATFTFSGDSGDVSLNDDAPFTAQPQDIPIKAEAWIDDNDPDNESSGLARKVEVKKSASWGEENGDEKTTATDEPISLHAPPEDELAPEDVDAQPSQASGIGQEGEAKMEPEPVPPPVDAPKKEAAEAPKNSGCHLVVKGLTSQTRATELRPAFVKHGRVVGAKIVTSGKTCFGFITMGSAADAVKCIQHLHRTDFRGRQINVERASDEFLASVNKASKPKTATAPSPAKPVIAVAAATNPKAKVEPVKETSKSTKRPRSKGPDESAAKKPKTSSTSTNKPTSKSTESSKKPSSKGDKPSGHGKVRPSGHREGRDRERHKGSDVRARSPRRFTRPVGRSGPGLIAPPAATRREFPAPPARRDFAGPVRRDFAAPVPRRDFGRAALSPPRRLDDRRAPTASFGRRAFPSPPRDNRSRLDTRAAPGLERGRMPVGGGRDDVSGREQMLLEELRKQEAAHREREHQLEIEREKERLRFEREKFAREKLEFEQMKLATQLREGGLASLPQLSASATLLPPSSGGAGLGGRGPSGYESPDRRHDARRSRGEDKSRGRERESERGSRGTRDFGRPGGERDRSSGRREGGSSSSTVIDYGHGRGGDASSGRYGAAAPTYRGSAPSTGDGRRERREEPRRIEERGGWSGGSRGAPPEPPAALSTLPTRGSGWATQQATSISQPQFTGSNAPTAAIANLGTWGSRGAVPGGGWGSGAGGVGLTGVAVTPYAPNPAAINPVKFNSFTRRY